MRCPKCGIELQPVPQPGWMNADQWDAVKAGDWFRREDACEADGCLSARIGANPNNRYATDRDLARYADAEAAVHGW